MSSWLVQLPEDLSRLVIRRWIFPSVLEDFWKTLHRRRLQKVFDEMLGFFFDDDERYYVDSNGVFLWINWRLSFLADRYYPLFFCLQPMEINRLNRFDSTFEIEDLNVFKDEVWNLDRIILTMKSRVYKWRFFLSYVCLTPAISHGHNYFYVSIQEPWLDCLSFSGYDVWYPREFGNKDIKLFKEWSERNRKKMYINK